MTKTTFTSESVCAGHPDKICDQISDAVLDAVLTQDRFGRVACETLVGFNRVVLSGEITANAKVDFKKIAREQIKRLGYTDPKFNFSDKSSIDLFVHEQSAEIAVGVKKRGAGDQGCLKKGTLVRTKKGFIPIEDVNMEDYVSTPYGWKKVLESKKTGIKKVIDITLTNGMSLTCTKDHKVLCFDRRGETYWKAANDLQPGEFICTLKPQQSFSNTFRESYVPKSTFFGKYNHKIYGPEKLIFDDKLGYITGELVGDGYVASPKLMDLAFGTNDTHAQIVQNMTSYQMPSQWRLVTYGNHISLKIDSVLVRKHFQNYGLNFNKAFTKETPDGIYLSPKEVIRNYLSGLFDSDGTIVASTGRAKKNIRIRLGSVSLKLLMGVQLLLNDFSIKSSILFNAPIGKPVGKKGKNGKIYRSKDNHYVLSLIGCQSYLNFYKEIGFLDERKQQRLIDYTNNSSNKPQNSRGIFLVPHPRKDELIDETRLGIELPYSIGIFKEKIDQGEIADVYDLEVEDVHMFSGNGMYVHNSMFGFACKETISLMPLPIMMAHALARRMDQVREEKVVDYLRPDGKSQVTIEYKNGKPTRVVQVVIAIPHKESVDLSEVKDDIYRVVVVPVLDTFGFKIQKKDIIVNGTGVWHHGGPAADCGVTGRKIVVDGYGGYARVGGGAFSGKDPTKVDRSGAYAARFLAKNIVAQKLADRAEVRLAYFIGAKKPTMQDVETFGTNKKSQKVIISFMNKILDTSVSGIIDGLDLQKPIYLPTAAYGHFGREEFPWERVV